MPTSIAMEITGFEDTAKRPLTTALPQKPTTEPKPRFFPPNRTETDRSRPVWNRNNTTIYITIGHTSTTLYKSAWSDNNKKLQQ